MTDEEIICEFMEPGPIGEYVPCGYKPEQQWWIWDGGKPKPKPLTLDRLREVEARLIQLGYRSHIDNQLSIEVWRDAAEASTWHASAEQKIKALATVLKGAKRR